MMTLRWFRVAFGFLRVYKGPFIPLCRAILFFLLERILYYIILYYIILY